MRYADMPQHLTTFPSFRRKDGEVFQVAATLYETPITMDYWRAHYVAAHAKWGDMHFNLFVPKKMAPNLALITALIAGAPLSQITAELQTATSAGRDLNWFPSPDGWQLVG